MGLGALLVLVVIGYFAVAAFVNHLLNSGGLARAVGKKTGAILKADAGYLPFFWRGLTVRSDGLLVRGNRPEGLQEMQVQNICASCNLRSLWQRKFVIERLTADHLEAAFGKAAREEMKSLLPHAQELQPPEDTPSPLKLVISETILRQLDLFWGDKAGATGAIRSALVKFYPDGADLNAVGTDGTLEQSGWPKLRIARVEAHYAKPRLELRSGRFAIGKAEDLTATGFFDFPEGGGGGMQLNLQAAKVPAEPFLKGYWKGKFTGSFDSDSQIAKKFQPGAQTSARGALKFLQAELHDVPTLDKVALLTRHPQFAHLHLDELRGHYEWTGNRLEVRELQVEAKKLICIEGSLTIANEEIDGNLQIGATAEVLDTIPGAREKVFTRVHDGYCWTSLKLSGPLKHPHEDLKQRLVTAAEEQLAKGFLAPLLKPGKAILRLLGGLYE